ncbi:MAG: hypothetical protein ACOYL3_12745 [Desulfuromonadaceae bacterium]
MKREFTLICLLLSALHCVSVSNSLAAETNKTVIQLEAARTAVATAAAKTEGNKEATADLERARTALKYADESLKEGKSMFGFGEVTPEAEKEIKISVDAAEIATVTALSRIEFVRAAAELEVIEKQSTTVKARLKLFEDRKAELERLRRDSEACRKTSNELEVIKLEKATLASQVDQLNAERSRADRLKIEQLELTRKMDELKVENDRLSALLEKQAADLKAAVAPVPEEPNKKPAKKP